VRAEGEERAGRHRDGKGEHQQMVWVDAGKALAPECATRLPE